MVMQELSVHSVQGGWGKSMKISTTTNKIWLFSMPDSSLSRGILLGRAYSVDNQGLGDSYEVLCPLKFRRSLPRINFRVKFFSAKTLVRGVPCGGDRHLVPTQRLKTNIIKTLRLRYL